MEKENVLVTDNLFYPLEMNEKNTEVYTWHNFIELAKNGFEIDRDIILYIDVDNLDEILYEQFKQWKQASLDIIFITYDGYKPSFLSNVTVDKVGTSEIPIKKFRTKDEIKISFLNNDTIKIRGDFLVYTTNRKSSVNCDNKAPVNKFFIKVKQQLKAKNVDMIYMNDHTTKFENNFNNKIIATPNDLAEELSKIEQEVKDRFKFIEKYESNATDEQTKILTIYELPEDIMPKTKFYIFDNFVDILKSSDTNSRTTIINAIKFIFSVSNSVGIIMILVIDDTDELIELLFGKYKNTFFNQIVFIDGSSSFMSRAFNISESEATNILYEKTNKDIIVSGFPIFDPTITTIDFINYAI